jgi:hypothetical protein
MSFSLIQEAAGFSLTTQFIDSKKIVSVTPQNPKFTPKTNLEVGFEVRDRLLELFIKMSVFCRTWFLKNLVIFKPSKKRVIFKFRFFPKNTILRQKWTSKSDLLMTFKHSESVVFGVYGIENMFYTTLIFFTG